MDNIYNITITHTISVMANTEAQAIEIAKNNLDLDEVPNAFIFERKEKIKVEEEKDSCRFVVDIRKYL